MEDWLTFQRPGLYQSARQRRDRTRGVWDVGRNEEPCLRSPRLASLSLAGFRGGRQNARAQKQHRILLCGGGGATWHSLAETLGVLRGLGGGVGRAVVRALPAGAAGSVGTPRWPPQCHRLWRGGGWLRPRMKLGVPGLHGFAPRVSSSQWPVGESTASATAPPCRGQRPGAACPQHAGPESRAGGRLGHVAPGSCS